MGDESDRSALRSPIAIVHVAKVASFSIARETVPEGSGRAESQGSILADAEAASIQRAGLIVLSAIVNIRICKDCYYLGRAIELELIVIRDVASPASSVREDAIDQLKPECTSAVLMRISQMFHYCQ
jgi:hypothetical protein